MKFARKIQDILLFSPALLAFAPVQAQNDPDKLNKKPIEHKNKALSQAVDGDLKTGIATLEQAIPHRQDL